MSFLVATKFTVFIDVAVIIAAIVAAVRLKIRAIWLLAAVSVAVSVVQMSEIIIAFYIQDPSPSLVELLHIFRLLIMPIWLAGWVWAAIDKPRR